VKVSGKKWPRIYADGRGSDKNFGFKNLCKSVKISGKNDLLE